MILHSNKFPVSWHGTVSYQWNIRWTFHVDNIIADEYPGRQHCHVGSRCGILHPSMRTDSNLWWGARGKFHPYARTDFIGLMCLHGKYYSLSHWVSPHGNIPFHGEPTWKYSVPWEPTTEIILLFGSLRGNIPFLGSRRGNDSTPWESLRGQYSVRGDDFRFSRPIHTASKISSLLVRVSARPSNLFALVRVSVSFSAKKSKFSY
jgi:hypothetical protein